MKITKLYFMPFQKQFFSSRSKPLISFNSYIDCLNNRFYSTKINDKIIKELNGKTPLHIAIITGESLEKIKQLRSEGYKIDVRDNAGNTPLMLAVSHPKTAPEIIEYLIRNDADVQNFPNKKGDTVANLAIQCGPEMVKIVNEALKKHRGFPANHLKI